MSFEFLKQIEWTQDHAACTRDFCENSPTSYIPYFLKCNNIVPQDIFPLVASVFTCLMLKYLSGVISSLLFQTYNKLSDADKVSWQTRCVAYIHAVVSSMLVLYTLPKEPQTWYDSRHGWAPSYNTVLMISVGYFVYDLIETLKEKPLDVAMVVHHTICVVAITYCVNYRMGILYCITLLFTEITTPFFHMRWFMIKAGMEKTTFFKVNGMIFWVLFFLGRVLWCGLQVTHLIVFYHTYSTLQWFCIVPIVVPGFLFVLNLYWFILITKRVLSQGKNKKE